MKATRRIVAGMLVALTAAISACAPAPVQRGPGAFSFGLIGDLPYLPREEQTLEDLLRAMDAQPLAFVVHDGDIKNGSSRCTDEVFRWNKSMFDSSRHPFIYVPGDNEWTDCHRGNNGGYDPRERLAKLRAVFYATDETLGARRFTLTRQSADPRYAEYRENVRWTFGRVLFVGLNIPGSNNNFGRSPDADTEYRARNAANLEWMRQAFDIVKRDDLLGLVLVIQADPFFEQPRGHRSRRGFEDFLAQLETGTVSLGRPVMLVHGDTHQYRLDQPMRDARNGRTVENFTRLETYGSPVLGWVRVTVDPADPKLFVVEPFPYVDRQ